jgi:hypothetical protein
MAEIKKQIDGRRPDDLVSGVGADYLPRPKFKRWVVRRSGGLPRQKREAFKALEKTVRLA